MIPWLAWGDGAELCYRRSRKATCKRRISPPCRAASGLNGHASPQTCRSSTPSRATPGPRRSSSSTAWPVRSVSVPSSRASRAAPSCTPSTPTPSSTPSTASPTKRPGPGGAGALHMADNELKASLPDDRLGGDVIISDLVIAKLAGRAARRTYGVVGMPLARRGPEAAVAAATSCSRASRSTSSTRRAHIGLHVSHGARSQTGRGPRDARGSGQVRGRERGRHPGGRGGRARGGRALVTARDRVAELVARRSGGTRGRARPHQRPQRLSGARRRHRHQHGPRPVGAEADEAAGEADGPAAVAAAVTQGGAHGRPRQLGRHPLADRARRLRRDRAPPRPCSIRSWPSAPSPRPPRPPIGPSSSRSRGRC